ncbi:MAG: MATE family efflux transporter [Clostridia bacterium]|nr:MATE family efflux transporter [Clostridia bacterium]
MLQDMTTGSPAKKIILFTIPVLIGMLFQQLYSTIDSVIVGQLLGPNALGAVGATGSITFLVLGLAFGSCSGFAIPVAQEFGAGNMPGVRRCVANIIYVGAVISIVLSVVTALLTRQILALLNTPADLMEDAYNYLFWIFAGLGAQILYNMLAGILRSVGDSRTPLVFLVISCVLNIFLDILFVGPMGMGTAGAAIATVIAQLVSGLLCILQIKRKIPALRLKKEDMYLHMPTVTRLLGMGLPMGLQFSITAIGSIVLQKAVNGLGTVYVNSVAVASKVYGLTSTPIEACAVAASTYAGQNYGAGNIARVRKGVRANYAIMAVCSLAGFLVAWQFSDTISTLFISPSETAILENVRMYLFYSSMFYFLLSSLLILRNTLQGVGYSKAAMLSGAFELVGRAAMGAVIVPRLGYIAACFGHPAAWIMANIILIPLYIVLMKKLEKRMPPAKV